jgi:outer membrane lipoprotein carrier protein
MKIQILLLGTLGLLITFPTFAASATKRGSQKNDASKTSSSKLKKLPKLPDPLLKIEALYQAKKTLFAKFEQTQTGSLTSSKTLKQTSGVLSAKHPNRMRWETLKPDQNLLVSDGKTFWFFTPPFDSDEKGQVMIRRSSEVQSRIANALLAARFSEVFKLGGVSIDTKSDRVYHFHFSGGVAGSVKRLELSLDPKLEKIESVKLFHENGQESKILLSQIELGSEMGDEMFFFTPPPGTEVIRE